jgi:hypothetical protein
MGFCGLTPSEYSSGERTRRGRITKTGNGHLRAQLVESASRLPVPRRGHPRAAPPPGRPATRGRRPRLAGAAAVVRPLPSPARPQTVPTGGGHRHRSRAGRLPVGRDGRLACPTRSDPSTGRRWRDRGRHDAPAPRRWEDRSPAVLCHQAKPGACLVRGTFLRIADLRSQPANIPLAGSRPTPRRRVMPTTGPAHHRRTGPASTITAITIVVLKRVSSP